jgi:hypothetical protein
MAEESAFWQSRLRIPKDGPWTETQFRDYVLGEVRWIAHNRRPIVRSAPSLSRRARDHSRAATRLRKLAARNPTRASEYLADAAGFAESAKLICELSRIKRDPQGAHSDRRHTTHRANARLIWLLQFVHNITGSRCYNEIAALLTAEGFPVKPNWLRAVMSRHKPVTLGPTT